MSVSETFDRKFNKSMRGYNTEEVDAALDALLRYCDELEDANREFEIANNDLIDDKTELNKYISELVSEKEELEKKLKEKSERVSAIEALYNGYREKFGEARDMITKAKASSAEIIARAKDEADFVAREARKKQEKELREFDIEIEKRRVLIEKLDICYNDFSNDIKNKLVTMLDRVDSFATSPALPAGLPEMRPVIEENIQEITELQDIFAEPDIPVSETASLPTDEEDDVEIIEEPQMTPFDFDNSEDEEKDNDLISYELSDKHSKMSQMKGSLNEINQRVLKKKSTPHI